MQTLKLKTILYMYLWKIPYLNVKNSLYLKVKKLEGFSNLSDVNYNCLLMHTAQNKKRIKRDTTRDVALLLLMSRS